METKAQKFKKLGERFSKLSKVVRLDEGEDKEAWTLAHAFLDLEESFRKFTDVYLPKLSEEQLTDEEVYDLLLDIGEEFRHILYHIHDPKFYSYLLDAE